MDLTLKETALAEAIYNQTCNGENSAWIHIDKRGGNTPMDGWSASVVESLVKKGLMRVVHNSLPVCATVNLTEDGCHALWPVGGGKLRRK